MVTPPRSKPAAGRAKAPPRPGLGTTADLLRALGVARPSVDHARANGNITPALIDSDGRVWWDIAATVADYGRNVRRRIDAIGNTTMPGSAEVKAAIAAAAAANPDTPPTEVDQRPGGPERLPGETYEQARLRLTVAEANKRELEVATKRGELIPREAVLSALTAAATVLKDGLSAFGSRFAQQLANEPDPRRCKEIIDDGARALLVGMRSDLERKLPALRDGAAP